MTKRVRRIVILLVILVVLCVATLLASLYNEKQEQIQNSNEIVLSISTDSVAAVSWEVDDTALGFTLDSETGTWIYDDDSGFPTSTSEIENLLSVFEEYEADFIIEEVDDYSQYGLDDPVMTINITLDDETSYEITLGNFSTLDSERYVSIGDGNVYLAVVDPYDTYDVELSDMIEDDTIASFTEATEIVFTGVENYSIYYEADSTNTYCSDDVYFVSDSDLPLDTDNVETYIGYIRNTGLNDYVTYNASDDELELYGMNNPVLTITATYPVTETDDDGEEVTSTETVTLTIGVNQDELTEAQEALEDEDDEVDISSLSLYVRVNDSQIIYELASNRYNYLISCGYDDLRHAEVLTADYSSIYQLDFTIEDVTYTIYSELSDPDDEESDRVYYYYYDGEVIDADSLSEDDDISNYRVEVDIDDIESAIDAVTAESYTSEEADGKLELSLTAYLDNENYPEVTVELYRYDGTYCLAVINGEPTSLVTRSAVVDLIETINSIVL
ncbi:MAG: DUF4340 domain-containing protein [Oscillospiraceae bacterium]|nr:DUF4340 domain-containing protein [Oscillospiraceae bacterium]